MSCTEGRKKKGNAGLIRIFQKSVQEMGHGEKLLHSLVKSNKSPPKKETETKNTNETPPMNQVPAEDLSKEGLSDNESQKEGSWQHKAYPHVPKERTPPRFWKFKVKEGHKRDKPFDKGRGSHQNVTQTDKNNNVSVNAQIGKWSTEFCVDNNNSNSNPTASHLAGKTSTEPCIDNNSNTYPTASRQNEKTSTEICVDNNNSISTTTTSHQRETDSGTVSKLSHSFPHKPQIDSQNNRFRNHTDRRPQNSSNLSCVRNSMVTGSGQHDKGSDNRNTNPAPDIHKSVQNVMGTNRISQRHPNQNLQHHNQQDMRKTFRNSSNGHFHRPNSFHDQQKRFRDQTCRKMDGNANLTSKSTLQSEDWSDDLLNVSDWNDDNMMEEKSKGVSMCSYLVCEENNQKVVTEQCSRKHSVDTDDSVWSEIDLNSNNAAEKVQPSKSKVSDEILASESQGSERKPEKDKSANQKEQSNINVASEEKVHCVGDVSYLKVENVAENISVLNLPATKIPEDNFAVREKCESSDKLQNIENSFGGEKWNNSGTNILSGNSVDIIVPEDSQTTCSSVHCQSNVSTKDQRQCVAEDKTSEPCKLDENEHFETKHEVICIENKVDNINNKLLEIKQNVQKTESKQCEIENLVVIETKFDRDLHKTDEIKSELLETQQGLAETDNEPNEPKTEINKELNNDEDDHKIDENERNIKDDAVSEKERVLVDSEHKIQQKEKESRCEYENKHEYEEIKHYEIETVIQREQNQDSVIENETQRNKDSKADEIDSEIEISTHGEIYDALIKEKIQDTEHEAISKGGKKRDNATQLEDFLYPDFDQRVRSHSLPGSPYMQVVELMKQFRHNEMERNILLEKQRRWQSLESESVNKSCNSSVTSKNIARGRGRATVSLSDESSKYSNSDGKVLQSNKIMEDWEADLISLDQHLISDTTDNDEMFADIGEKLNTSLNDQEQKLTQTQPIQSYVPKPFSPKGRGCLSPNFNSNLGKFLKQTGKKLVSPERKGFDVHNFCKPEVEKQNIPKQHDVKHHRENWESSLIDVPIDGLHCPLLESTFQEKELFVKNTDHPLDIQEAMGKSCGQKEPVENALTIDNMNFEQVDCYIMDDSSSGSSRPQYDLLTFSPKSQSTLSGVPTMSDYENSEAEFGPLDDVSKSDVKDVKPEESYHENTFKEIHDGKTIENLSVRSPLSQITGEFVINADDFECDNAKPIDENDIHGMSEAIQNDENPHFMSYVYPDLSGCHCHPSVQQYWMWHTCACQVPRLCEIRMCSDYSLQYPFGDMEGIYRTVQIPDVNNNNKRNSRRCDETAENLQDDTDRTPENKSDYEREFPPPGFSRQSRRQIIPPPMPFASGVIPPPPPRQIIEKMMQSVPAGPHVRMGYRGPQPKSREIPVHLVKQHSSQTVVSPFVCAQGFYQKASPHSCNTSPTPDKNRTIIKKEKRHDSDSGNGEQNDSGVVLESSPGFIGPILPSNVKLPTSKKSISPMSAIRELINEANDIPRKRLVDYSYSETDDSEDSSVRSRASHSEKRQRGEDEVVTISDSSASESESSKRQRSKFRQNLDSRLLMEKKEIHVTKTDYVKKKVISDEKVLDKEEGEITDESEDDSSRFLDCSSTLSNYQILQTVLNKKFPHKQRMKHSGSHKGDGDSTCVDLTDEGSEIISVVSQESTEQEIKYSSSQNQNYPQFWPSPDSRNESPICGYGVMYPPYSYPGWVSPEMISAKYASCNATTPPEYQRRHSYSPSEFPPRKETSIPVETLSSPTEDIGTSRNECDDIEERLRRGNVSIRGMEARLRFFRNSKMAENETAFQSRIAMLQKTKQSETDSDSQSSLTANWKVRFLNKCRGYKGTYIDSHCHLDFLFNRSGFGGTWTKFKKDNADTMPPNFDGCVAVFCHPSSFRQDGLWKEIALEEDVWLTFGCHPKNATEYTDRTELNMKMCLMHPRVVALGEIGLDYSGIFEKHKEVQQIVFRKQIQIALDMNKPLVIHCRDAEVDTLAILDEMVPKNYKIHCHCFTGTYESAKKWMDMFPNLFIGLTPLVTYRTATPSHEVARFIPLERLLLETDAPYFVPRKCPRPEVQHSHPGMAITVAEEVAWLKKCPIAEVLYSCRQNTRLMYGI